MKNELERIIRLALDEDQALNDVTSDLTIDDDYQIDFKIASRENIILCGVDAIKITFDILQESTKFKDSKLDYDIIFQDKNLIKNNEIIAKGSGNAKLILAGERVILNLMQHLSGISTLTRKFIDELCDDNIKILDTRKTTLGLRNLEKYAVKIGGATNHRNDLSDMILIKDNHIAASKTISNAIEKSKNNGLKIEIECDNLKQVSEAIKSKPDIIMLDNMKIDKIKEAIKIIDKKAKIEVSGGINLENIKNYRGLAIDYISVGALTHSAKSVDIGLDVV